MKDIIIYMQIYRKHISTQHHAKSNFKQTLVMHNSQKEGKMIKQN